MENTKPNKWRLDDNYETVYKYNADQKTYIYFCSYYSASIALEMTEKKQIQLVERYEANKDIIDTEKNYDYFDVIQY